FVKGPAGFMLANAEPGGLINTVTKQPTHQQISEVTFATGSWNMMRTSIDLGGEFKKEGKLTYRLNAGAQKNNEYYKFGEFNRFFVAPVLKYDFTDQTSLTLEHNYVKARAQENTHTSISANGDIWALPIDLAINDPNNDPWQAEDIYNRAYLKHQFSENWTFNAQAAYMTTTWGGTTLALEGISEGKDTLFRAANYNDWYGRLTNLQMFLDGRFYTGANAEHKVLIGIDYGDGMETSTNGGTWGELRYPLAIAEPTYYLPKDSLKFTGELYTWMARNRWQAIYVQDHLKLFDKFILTLAGRFTKLTTGQDWNSPPDDPEYEITENKFTPRIGLTYMFSKNISAYVLHDESFLSQRGAIFGGGRLPPLTGRNNEAGVKALFFNQQLSVAASVYDIIKNNVGNSDPIHAGFYLKTGQVRSRGIELDLAGKINTNLYINANYSYSDAKITRDEDKSLIGLQNNGTAKNLANAWVKYQVNSGKLRGFGIGGGLQHTGKRSAVWPGYNSSEGNRFLPSYTIFDASLSYATSKFYVGLNVFNITNQRYATSGSYEPYLQEYLFDIEPPVNFRLSTTIKL
ncbi:MAG: TonB-dependent siderophore receptor, partial [Chitinophagaceae bacterium]|nr:TonB-dependent siderophore receptor [Chitinophagaceae bacterium]